MEQDLMADASSFVTLHRVSADGGETKGSGDGGHTTDYSASDGRDSRGVPFHKMMMSGKTDGSNLCSAMEWPDTGVWKQT
jgi:hypothetical protein